MVQSDKEILDIINEQNEVVGQASLNDVFDRKLSCRIVHVIFRNERSEIACQVRSNKKYFCPGCYSTTVGGHVQAGESPEQAAAREMKEEVGIEAKLDFIFSTWYEGAGFKKVLYVYEAKSEQPFVVNKDEVDEIEYLSFEKVRELPEDKVHPELKFIINKLENEKN